MQKRQFQTPEKGLKIMEKKSLSPLISTILTFQLLTDLVVILDIAYARQIIAFVYLTFVPGYAVLKVLKLDKGDFYESLLFTVGLSIALLMFVGLFLDLLLPIFGMNAPLTTMVLLGAMNAIVVPSCLAIHFRGIHVRWANHFFDYPSLLFMIIPLLGICGTLFVNYSGNNVILLIMLAVIAGLIVTGTVWRKILPEKIYPLAILVMAVALVFHSALVTNYLFGYDVHSEYNVFKQTDSAAYWNPTFSSVDDRIGKGHDMLSSTILPVIYSKIAAIQGTWLMKILFSLILSFVPLALYKLYSLKLRKEVAFFAAFFVMANFTFFGTDGFPTKQMVGEFYYVLLFFVLLKNEISNAQRSFFFVLFGASLVVSHYSMSYIFLLLISITWVLVAGMRHFNIGPRITSRLSSSLILIFFTTSFAWYIFTSTSAPFDAIVKVGEQVSQSFFVDFFNPLARTPTVLRGLGVAQSVSFGHQIGQIFFYAAELLIIVGVAIMMIKKENAKFGHEYAILSVLNLMILVMAIVLPNFARYFRMERFYQVSLLFLAPFFVLGGEAVFDFITRRKHQALALKLILIVLIPFFLFETGFIYEVTRDYSYSIPLSNYRMDLLSKYDRIVDGKEVVAANWLLVNSVSSKTLVYGDYISTYKVLTSYALMSGETLRELLNTTQFTSGSNYVYLREVNTICDVMRSQFFNWNTSDVQWILNNQSLIYSNKDSMIFFVRGETNSVSP